jgi:hypothetical protein
MARFTNPYIIETIYLNSDLLAAGSRSSSLVLMWLRPLVQKAEPEKPRKYAFMAA